MGQGIRLAAFRAEPTEALLVSAEHCVEHEYGQSGHDENGGKSCEGIEAHAINIGEQRSLVDTDLR